MDYITKAWHRYIAERQLLSDLEHVIISCRQNAGQIPKKRWIICDSIRNPVPISHLQSSVLQKYPMLNAWPIQWSDLNTVRSSVSPRCGRLNICVFGAHSKCTHIIINACTVTYQTAIKKNSKKASHSHPVR